MFLHQSHAPSHKLPVAMTKLTELGFELVIHPPYCTNLTPCDFFLFRNFKIGLGAKKFSPTEPVMEAINEFFAGFENIYFADGMKKLESRSTKCVALDVGLC